MKRYIIILLLVFVLCVFQPALVGAVTLNVAQQIEALKQQILYLQSLLTQAQQQPHPQPSLQNISSQAYMVMDITSGQVLLEKNSLQQYPIASITKLMNAVVTVENIDQTKTITLTEAILRPTGYSPALFLGATVSAKDLLKASLIQSTNDAANALASFMGTKKFVSYMNQKAGELAMNDTAFYDPHGLNPANHSAAADLAKLLTYIYNNHPELLAIGKDNNFQLPGSTGKLLTFKNVNNFYASPDFIGGKTGYLPEARQTLASLFEIHKKPMAVVVLYSENRYADTRAIIDWVTYSAE